MQFIVLIISEVCECLYTYIPTIVTTKTKKWWFQTLLSHMRIIYYAEDMVSRMNMIYEL